MSLPAPDASIPADTGLRHDRAFAYLKSLLLDGGLEPGATFSTDEVARVLKISRAPATDAVKRLVRDGFINVIPQVGCVVTTPTPREVEDFYQLFARSEAVFASLAAQRCTAAQSVSFTAAVATFEAQFQALRGVEGSGPKLRALNRQHFEAIHEMADSKAAGELVANMSDRSDFYIRIAYGQFVYSRQTLTTNQTIAKAILAGNASVAAKTTEAWLEKVGIETAAEMRRQATKD